MLAVKINYYFGFNPCLFSRLSFLLFFFFDLLITCNLKQQSGYPLIHVKTMQNDLLKSTLERAGMFYVDGREQAQQNVAFNQIFF